MQNHSDLNRHSFFQQLKESSSIILLIVPIVLTIWVCLGKQAHFNLFFPRYRGSLPLDAASTIYEYLAAFALMGLIPWVIVKFVWKRPLAEFGLTLGDRTYGFRFVAVTVPLCLLMAWLGSQGADVQAEYPLAKSMLGRPSLFLMIEVFYFIYYLGWEFLFRGFILFGLEARFGAVAAILIQTIPSAIVHIGKPAGESFGAIIAGLVFGYLAVRTRSILYPLILHAILGIGLDLFMSIRV